MDRIVSQFLTELDTQPPDNKKDKRVYVIGATNRPDMLDQALLRPGRFDKIVYLGVDNSLEGKSSILQA